MAYVKSELIDVFPVSFTRPKAPLSNVLSERSIRTIMNSLSYTNTLYTVTDELGKVDISKKTASFVISETFDKTQDFEFLVNGYYVKIAPHSDELFVDDLGNRFVDVYAVLIVDKHDKNYPLLDGVDDIDGNFTGVTFVQNINDIQIDNDEKEGFYLHILHLDGDSYVIPSSSLKSIDGGYFE